MTIYSVDCHDLLQEVDHDSIRLLATNLSEFVSETITKIKRESNDAVKFELNYRVTGGNQMRVTFDTRRANEDERTAFLSSLMMTAFENNLLVKRMKLELERKDAEIEDFRSNGAVLMRGESYAIRCSDVSFVKLKLNLLLSVAGALATEKFNFEHMREAEAVNRQNKLQSLNQVLVKENLPEICRLINVDPDICGTSTQESSSLRQKESKSSKVSSQPSRKMKPMTKKDFLYDNEDASELVQSEPSHKRVQDGESTQNTTPNSEIKKSCERVFIAKESVLIFYTNAYTSTHLHIHTCKNQIVFKNSQSFTVCA